MDEFNKQIIGEFVGIEAAIQAIIGQIALLPGQGNEAIKAMHVNAHTFMDQKIKVDGGYAGIDVLARAENLLDRLFSQISVASPTQTDTSDRDQS